MNNNLNFTSEDNPRNDPYRAMFVRSKQISHNPKPKQMKDDPENIRKERLKALRGMKEPDRCMGMFHEPMDLSKPAFSLGTQNDPTTSLVIENEQVIKLTQENQSLKMENENLKKNLGQTQAELKNANEKIVILEKAIEELKNLLKERDNMSAEPQIAQEEEGNIEIDPIPEPIEEVKQEIQKDQITEVAKKLNCDISNEEELKSIELAMQLEAEERQTMQRNLLIQQDEALRALDNAPRGIALNPEQMTYEQLLDLEEKIGSVSKGLKQAEIDAMPIHAYIKTDTVVLYFFNK